MKKLLFILIALFIIGSANASDTLTSRNKALICSISSLIDIKTTQSLAFQFKTGSNSALRLNTGFGYSGSTTQKPSNTEKDRTFDSLDLFFNPCFIYFLDYNSKVRPYTGFGIIINSISSNLKGIDFKSTERSISKLEYGANIFLGTEWFPDDNFSIGVEYELIFKFISGDITYRSGGNEQNDKLPNETKILIKPSSLGLYLSYYFD